LPDRFIKGGMEQQPEGFKARGKEESTGGSSPDGLEFGRDNDSDDNQDYQQYFRRDPLIT